MVYELMVKKLTMENGKGYPIPTIEGILVSNTEKGGKVASFEEFGEIVKQLIMGKAHLIIEQKEVE